MPDDPPPVRYRYVESNDAEAIAAYHVRCWHADYRSLLSDEVVDAVQLATALPAWRAELESTRNEPLVHTVVATQNGQPVGHATVGPAATDGRGEVRSLYVDPNHQRQGIGRELLTMATRLLRRDGHPEAELWTFPANERAIQLYRSNGWQIDGTTTKRLTVGSVEVEHLRMIRSLDPEAHVRQNRSYWNDEAPDYAVGGRRLWSCTSPEWGIFAIPDERVDLMPEVTDKAVIELGCGTGYVSAWCLRAGARHVVGLDNSPAQLATADSLQREFGQRFPLIHADAEHAPFADQSFDVAISEYGASLWCDPYRWIPEAARLLRPNGVLVFLTNSIFLSLAVNDFEEIGCTAELQRPLRSMHSLRWPDIDGTEFHLAHGEMIRLLRASGFEVVDLIELFADASDDTSYSFVSNDWAANWPHEEAWVARRTGQTP